MLLPTLCKTAILTRQGASDVRDPPCGYPCWTLNFCPYKPFAMCLILLHFQPCAGSEPNCCCCCLSNKYTYMQLRSPEVTRVNIHVTPFTSFDFFHSETRKLSALRSNILVSPTCLHWWQPGNDTVLQALALFVTVMKLNHYEHISMQPAMGQVA